MVMLLIFLRRAFLITKGLPLMAKSEHNIGIPTLFLSRTVRRLPVPGISAPVLSHFWQVCIQDAPIPTASNLKLTSDSNMKACKIHLISR